jgi:D-arabinose 5-phosphate isomerase GutQ
MLIIATSISGSGRKEYLNELTDYAKKFGKKIKI